jgi:hypothetical protein
VHALADSRHNSGSQIKGGIQYRFRNSFFPGVRQALIHSRLAVSDNSNRYSNQFFLSIGQQFGCMGVVIVFAKVCSFTHGKILLLFLNQYL